MLRRGLGLGRGTGAEVGRYPGYPVDPGRPGRRHVAIVDDPAGVDPGEALLDGGEGQRDPATGRAGEALRVAGLGGKDGDLLDGAVGVVRIGEHRGPVPISGVTDAVAEDGADLVVKLAAEQPGESSDGQFEIDRKSVV